MKNIKNKVLVLMGIALLSSCNDFLDETPDNRTRLDSPEAVSELLVSSYPEAGCLAFTEVMSDNVADKGIGGYIAEYQANEDAFFWKDSGAEDYDTPVFYWNACYTAIAAANEALNAIELASDKENYTAQKGEALATRAYSHFMLVNLFAKHYNPETAKTDLGVPFVEKSEKVVFEQYERATVQEVYDNIERDINLAFELIKDEAYSVPKYHMTKTALHAFASRFYLYKGEWDKVIEHSNYVLGANAASKLRDWTGKYMTYEAMELWAQYTKSEEQANLMLNRQYTNWGGGLVVFRYSLASSKATELFGESDAGEANFDLIIGSKLLYAAGELQLGFIPKFQNRTESHGGNADIGYPNSIVPIFTAEEVLFNRAEAYAMTTDYTSALSDLDAYYSKRSQTYNPDNKIDLNQIKAAYEMVAAPDMAPFYAVNADQKFYVSYLLDLRRREFVHEGLRWFDLKRYNIEVVHTLVDGSTVTLPKDDLRRAIQIPAQAVAIGLQANPR
ncbi:RagB/SusD family nutrient uptake outer membrane protein [Ancylomarina euxinus]|uniref:RagB/SusD family nutrient uptake outer membrane protein n=1 Tax=Ancylomarina euxinus TaxID=2283627 RepID=A0A425Y148_9BACT|nr:RagB/SusD family nutrient uptake outer membrane protein [Ancylomarina euxinus]MCZ4693748.1 RagB/SusD family nutrient uptake outer membrane protein [Ancylomarina euxinus]MUP15172.1 RagB/SusD family nutrient uptake outer membrane protein [Ancylomarina euxinus]RRG21594.1 RagB/SusD family nutrient uptake outer membrane protein [Ancylomarina euxinus]